MTFYVGQEVECIGDFSPRYGVMNVPIKGNVYKIRDIVCISENVGFHLVEISNPVVQFNDAYTEGSFQDKRFRPLVKKTTSIECFEKFLKEVKIKEPA